MKPLILLALLAATVHARPPNLLVIQTDEHNFRTLGCYRDTLPPEQAEIWGKGAVVETPNIDWLAKNGALCTSFYATTPVCSPSRGSLISGRYPHHTPVTTNNIPLGDDIITFAELLKRKGYATGYAGKWHLDGDGKPQWAPKRKFGFDDNRYMFNRGHWKKFEITAEGPRVGSRKNGKPDYGLAGADEKSFATDWLCDRTMDFITEHKDTPFCYMVALPDPHGPNTVRAPYDTMYNHLDIKPPSTMTNPGQPPNWGKVMVEKLVARQMALYFGMVRCIDDKVGEIIGTLREHGILENTMIVFTSDHGDLCGEHCRHNKGVPYEASAKVPFILYYPPEVPGGTVIDVALSCVDFLPTSFALLGHETAGLEQGRDASMWFTGKTPKWRDMAFLRSTGNPGKPGGGWLCAVSDRYKLVFSAYEQPWLFDLEKDPDEITNYFNDESYRALVRSMARNLHAYGTEHQDPYIEARRIKDDLAWAMGKEEHYAAPPGADPAAEAPAKKKKRKKPKKD